VTVSDHDPRDAQSRPDTDSPAGLPARRPAEEFGSALRALHTRCGNPPLIDLMEMTAHDIGRIEDAFAGLVLPDECVARCLVIALRGSWLDLSLMYHNAVVDVQMLSWWSAKQPGEQIPGD
jgi:hypothetical protein